MKGVLRDFGSSTRVRRCSLRLDRVAPIAMSLVGRVGAEIWKCAGSREGSFGEYTVVDFDERVERRP